MSVQALIHSLQAMRRRLKLLGVVYGIGLTIAASGGILLSAGLIDYLLNLSAAVRLILLLMFVGSCGYLAAQWAVMPALASLPLQAVAARLERIFPQLDDRLCSTVDFLQSDVPGSPLMQRQVTQETARIASRLKLERAIDFRPALLALGAAAAVIALMVMLAVASPHYASIALARLLHPFNSPEWPKRVQIELLTDVPARLPVGQRIDISMKLVRGDRPGRKASIFYQLDGGSIQKELMRRGDNGVYRVSLDARIAPTRQTSTLRVWLECGDDKRELPAITVVPRLAIRSVQIEVAPPAYASTRQTSTFNLQAAAATVTEGSRVAMTLNFSKALDPQRGVELIPMDQQADLPDIQWETNDPCSVRGLWTARKSARFCIRAYDTDGFPNSAIEQYELVVAPDRPPVVQIENPRGNEQRTATSVVPLAVLIEDDYGIEWNKLIVDRPSDRRQWAFDLDSRAASIVCTSVVPDRLHYDVGYDWDLSQLSDSGLKPGDTLEFHVLTRDNFELEGRRHDPVASARLRITIISQDELAAQVVQELRQLRDQIVTVKNILDRTREETRTLAEETAAQSILDPADRSILERLTSLHAASASQIEQIAGRIDLLRRRLAENRSPAHDLDDLSREVSEVLRQAADHPMKDAMSKLLAAGRSADAMQPHFADALVAAVRNQQTASEQLQQAIDRLGNVGSFQQMVQTLRQILTEQQEISRQTRQIGRQNMGKKLDQLSQIDRQKLDETATSQDLLAQKTLKAIQQMQKLVEQMSQSDRTGAEAMLRAVTAAQRQQVPQAQQQAASAVRQNQQSQAQSLQKQVDLGLELMLAELQQAQRHRLAELHKQLEQTQNLLANLIRRQAGHNLDNLTLQGPERLAGLDADLLRQLMKKAQREQDQPWSVSTVTKLAELQEQTERNTRNIASSMDSVSGSTEAASHMIRAASRMQRAVAYLRDQKLDEAYQPPQVHALAELELAERVLVDQQAKIQQQLEEQTRQTIREKYQKIKTEQESLNEQTVGIDRSRNPDGNLSRADLIRLTQLSTRQGELAEQIDQINHDLAALKSAVFLWANQDIAELMSEAKDQLAKHDPSASTQMRQQRIVEQLQSMIESLAIQPLWSKFAQDAAGGGAGAGGQSSMIPLPTEAELRLLRNLQQSVNRNTTSLDRLPQKDLAALEALGTRQSQLRQLLDQSIQKATGGMATLGPELPEHQLLPEETSLDEEEDRQLQADLLTASPDKRSGSQVLNHVGQRMARSRHRLAVAHDSGLITQAIQERIIQGLDELIEQARQQMAQTRNPPPGRSTQRISQASSAGASAQNQGQSPGGSVPSARSATPGPGGSSRADLSRDMRQTAAEWGAVSPRLRDAVLESAGEKVIEQYRRFVEDYYRAVAEQGAGNEK